jgi:hypothetical protein
LEEKNKPGAKPRDISDLKARLGLAKPGAAPAKESGAPGTPHAGGSSSLPAPFGAPAGRVPAPPGAQVSYAPPDARKDPFGAMSAAVATAAAAPRAAPIPFVDDGKPVESVQARSAHRAARLTLVGVLIAGWIIGYWWGAVVVDRKSYNRMIDDAGTIKVKVTEMAKTLSTIVDALNRDGQKFPTGLPDAELTAKLKGMSAELAAPDQERLFHTNYARFENIVIDELFNYYNDTIALYEQIRRHVTASERDKDLLDSFGKEAVKTDVNYGITIEPGRVTVSKLVQIVSPICKGGKTDCKNVSDLDGFMVTYAPGGTPFAAKLNGNGIRVMPLEHTALFDGMVAGAKPEALAGLDYKRRLANIRILATRLYGVQKSLLSHLESDAQKSKQFAL